MSAAVQAELARQIATANALLAETLFHLKVNTQCGIECAAELADLAPGVEVPAKTERTRKAIDEYSEEIALIRKVIAHMGFDPCPCPHWFEEIIAQGPDWAGGAS